METQTTTKILLYGNSILMAGLSSKLQQADGLEVEHMDGEIIGDLSDVDLIVVDLWDVKVPMALPKLSVNPNAVLVGLDALTDTATVLAGQPRSTVSMQRIMDLLQEAM